VLLFDMGNSRCKWGYVKDDRLLHSGVVDNVDWSVLEVELARLPTPSVIWASNVGGEVMAQRLLRVCANWSVPVNFVAAQAELCGVRNLYDQPEQLGSDRWAALIAAWHQVRRACLVVNCGTATTIDALSAQGEFIGGLILPGLTLMQQSLSQGTAQLSVSKGVVQNFPRNTADAIASGVLRATLGAIEHQFTLLQVDGEAVCILTGGAADPLMHFLQMPVQFEKNLVLKGLQLIGEAHA
jgi:type III pantothenate kinase